MKFHSDSSNHHRTRDISARLFGLALLPMALMLSEARAIAHHEDLAQRQPTTSALSSSALSPRRSGHAATGPVQQVSMNLPVASTSPTQNTEHNVRLLGYGLFLLQIGLVPLKLSKARLMQLGTISQSKS